LSAVVVRRDGPAGRFYSVDGELYPSVTHILGALSKPALIPWAAKVERELVLDTATELQRELASRPMSAINFRAALVARLGPTKAHARHLTTAGDIGSGTHKMIEWSLRRQLGADAGPEPVISEQSLWGYMAWQDFAKGCALKPLLTERVVYSKVHQFAGTLDLLARVNGVVTTIELKTSRAIWPEASLQSCAYRVAMEEMGYAPQASLIVRLPKLVTDPAFEVFTVPPVADLFPTFVALKQVWSWQWANEQAYRARSPRVA
jgi:genome maintenance exonuclease 1